MVWAKILSRPQRCATFANPAAMDSASPISTPIPTASGAPASRSLSTAASRATWSLAITATLAPSAAMVSAIASPIPLLPPVTTAFASVNPRSMVTPRFRRYSAPASYVGSDPSMVYAEPAQTERQCRLAYPLRGRGADAPLPLDARPHRTVQQIGIRLRVDAGKYPSLLTERELLDQRLQHLAICRADEFGSGEHLRLSLPG